MSATYPHSFGSTIRPRLEAGRRLLARVGRWLRRLGRWQRTAWYYPEREV